VVVSVALDAGKLHFSVRDSGIGIPADKQDRLFKSFSQVDSSTTRNFGGTGLGLAISKRLTELMGGRMWVESEAGKGSVFQFTILFKTVDAQPEATAPAPVRLNGKRLLVVEDHNTNREILTQYTAAWGMKSEAVAMGTDALSLLKRDQAFDVVVIDLQLPDMDAMKLVEEIRRLPGAQNLPIVLLTSVRLRAGDNSASLAGISVFVYKPIRRGQLLDALSRVVDGERQVRRAPTVSEVDKALATRMPLRILLADDNPVNLKVGQAYLLKMGYRAEVATNGIEVLQALERQPYDIVFLDVQMPEMDGYEAARQVCQRWTGSERPRMIAMTGNAMQGDREKCLAAGMDDYVAKPVRPKELESTLIRWGTQANA
jgi:CheY-like chemotaxis protein